MPPKSVLGNNLRSNAPLVRCLAPGDRVVAGLTAAYFACLERRLFSGGRKPAVEVVEDCLDGRAQLVFLAANSVAHVDLAAALDDLGAT
jgi:hypothetical protein